MGLMHPGCSYFVSVDTLPEFLALRTLLGGKMLLGYSPSCPAAQCQVDTVLQMEAISPEWRCPVAIDFARVKSFSLSKFCFQTLPPKLCYNRYSDR